MMKRAIDVGGALVGLALLAPLFVIVAVFVKLDSSGPVFFLQERIGRKFRPFWIYKFRTMVADAQQRGRAITVGQDPRITRVGRLLRQTKIDELPQLFNVLKGEMSFVGPRPEVRQYVELFREDYAEILRIAPGITDLASLKYRNEAQLLAQAVNPEYAYIHHILPEKIILAKEYTRRASVLFDLRVIRDTLWSVWRP